MQLHYKQPVHRTRTPDKFPDGPIARPWFYILSLRDLSAAQKVILWSVWDCYRRRETFQPTHDRLAVWLGCSRATVMRALDGLNGRHGWLRREWRGGRKSNAYYPEWRLLRLIERGGREGRR